MVKKIIYSLFVITIYSCSVFDGHNNYGKNCCDESTYHIIDTTTMYVQTDNISSNIIALKFYKEGRVVLLYNLSHKDKAEGKYCINKRQCRMKIFYKHPQGNFWSRKELTIRGDTILSHTLPSAQGRGSYDKYVKKARYIR